MKSFDLHSYYFHSLRNPEKYTLLPYVSPNNRLDLAQLLESRSVIGRILLNFSETVKGCILCILHALE